MRFLKNAPYKMFYKTSMEPDAKFCILDLSPKGGRPKKYDKIQFLPLYKGILPITTTKYKDMMDLLSYIPPIHHAYFKNLHHSNTDVEKFTPIMDDDEN
jgi:hypothetical protein